MTPDERAGAGAVGGVCGVHHLNLSVTDLDRSAAWYGEVLGLSEVRRGTAGDMSKVIMANDAGLVLGLTHHGPGASGDAFDERRTGMDHVAFTVADRAELDAWVDRLARLGVSHSGIEASALGELITLRDPDGVQLELFAPRPHGAGASHNEGQGEDRWQK